MKKIILSLLLATSSSLTLLHNKGFTSSSSNQAPSNEIKIPNAQRNSLDRLKNDIEESKNNILKLEREVKAKEIDFISASQRLDGEKIVYQSRFETYSNMYQSLLTQLQESFKGGSLGGAGFFSADGSSSEDIQIQGMLKSIQGLNIKISESQTQKQKIENEVTNLNSHDETLKLKFKNLELEIQSLTERRNTLSKLLKIDELNYNLKAKEAERDAFKTKIEEKRQLKLTLQDEISKLRAEFENLNRSKNKNKNKNLTVVLEKEERIASLDSNVAAATKSISRLESALTDINQSIAGISSDIQIKDKKYALSEQSRTEDRTQSNITELSKSIKDKSAERSNLEAEIKGNENKKGDYEKSISDLGAFISSHQEELLKTQQGLEAFVKEAGDKIMESLQMKKETGIPLSSKETQVMSQVQLLTPNQKFKNVAGMVIASNKAKKLANAPENERKHQDQREDLTSVVDRSLSSSPLLNVKTLKDDQVNNNDVRVYAENQADDNFTRKALPSSRLPLQSQEAESLGRSHSSSQVDRHSSSAGDLAVSRGKSKTDAVASTASEFESLMGLSPSSPYMLNVRGDTQEQTISSKRVNSDVIEPSANIGKELKLNDSICDSGKENCSKKDSPLRVAPSSNPQLKIAKEEVDAALELIQKFEEDYKKQSGGNKKENVVSRYKETVDSSTFSSIVKDNLVSIFNLKMDKHNAEQDTRQAKRQKDVNEIEKKYQDFLGQLQNMSK